MYFRQIEEPFLAQYAYLVGCQRTGEALVIDPQRDVDRYLRLAASAGLGVVAAADTHIHADFLSGARELAEGHGVRLYLSGEGGPDWRPNWATEADYQVQLLLHGDTFHVGNIRIDVMHTPGHTPEHLSFMITDSGGGADEPMGVATGDFVFVGDLGRPDLLESAAGVAGAMEPSARALYESTQMLLGLPDYLQVWPGHGAGSACGKALGAVPETTVGYERRFSPALAAAQRGPDAFVEYILEGQPEPPLYFARMKRLNRDGPPVLGRLPSPSLMAAERLADLVGLDDAVVIDTRADRVAFYAGHLPGSIHAPLTKSFHGFVGSYFDPTLPVYLIADEEQVEELVRSLVRIGIDDVRGYFTPDALDRYRQSGGALATTEVIDFAELERRRSGSGAPVLDVRRASEFEEGHVPGALNVAHTRLMPRMDEVRRAGQPLLVHCRSGNRASAATSFLERQGLSVVVVNDDFENWQEGPSTRTAHRGA